MKDLGQARRILGIEIDYNRAAGIMRLGQSAYLRSVIERHGYTSHHPVGSPIDRASVSSLGSPADLATADPSKSRSYLSALGQLLFAASTLRYDLAFVVSLLCRYAAAPTAACFIILKRALRYVRGTTDAQLIYRRQNGQLDLVGYCDAAWADDQQTSRSTGSWLFMLGSMPIGWRSYQQPDIASSSTEAEYMAAFYALHEGLQEYRWLEQTLPVLGIRVQRPVPLYVDNEGAIKLAHNPRWHSRTRQIRIRYHQIRRWVAEGAVKPTYVSTTDQLADLGTKALGVAHFRDLARRIGLFGIGSSGGVSTAA